MHNERCIDCDVRVNGRLRCGACWELNQARIRATVQAAIRASRPDLRGEPPAEEPSSPP